MIVGNGLTAIALKKIDNSKTIFFASGVSNSNETDPREFEREKKLLTETIKMCQDEKIVYLSTCSIYDKSKTNSMYVKHKLEMEKILMESKKRFLIFRISNIVGKGGNKNTLMNYLVNAIVNDQEITIYNNATRNLIDIEDVVNIIKVQLKYSNKIFNIAYPKNIGINQLVLLIEKFLNKEARKTFIDTGDKYLIDTSDVEFYFSSQNRSIYKYFENILKKYYLIE